jgi:heme-degrading monooxygenase HmoA
MHKGASDDSGNRHLLHSLGGRAAVPRHLRHGRRFIETSKGFHRLELRQGIEVPDSFILAVWWQTLEDHTQTFKQSENFTQWRAAIGHLFAAPPVVHHYSETV